MYKPKWLHEAILEVVERHAIRHDPLIAPDGQVAPVDFDLTRVTLMHKGLLAFSQAVVESIQEYSFDSIGGVGLAITPLVSSIVFRMPKKRGFYVRMRHEDDERHVEGSLYEGDRVILLTGTTVTGNHLLRAAERIRRNYHCQVVKVLAMIDCMKGAKRNLINAGYDFDCVISTREIQLRPSSAA